jgi:hypothetical protein
MTINTALIDAFQKSNLVHRGASLGNIVSYPDYSTDKYHKFLKALNTGDPDRKCQEIKNP